jgi:hypothetical protein
MSRKCLKSTSASCYKFSLSIYHHTTSDTHDLAFENHHNIGWMFIYLDYLKQQYVTTVAL